MCDPIDKMIIIGVGIWLIGIPTFKLYFPPPAFGKQIPFDRNCSKCKELVKQVPTHQCPS